MTNFIESDHPRVADGTFAEKTQSAPAVTLPEPLSGPDLDLLTSATDHFGADEFVEAVRGPYAGSIVVTDEFGCEYLVMDRDAAVDAIRDDLLVGGKAGTVDSSYLQAMTRIPSRVFDDLKSLGEPDASEKILNVLQAAKAVDKLAGWMASFESKLGEWLSNADGRAISLGDNVFAFRRF